MSEKKDAKTKPGELEVALNQGKSVIKTPNKPSKSKVSVKFVRNIDGNRSLVLSEMGVFYLVSRDVFESGSKTAEIVASDHKKPYDWSKMFDDVLPSREEMIARACVHLFKSGMVELSDLRDNAKRNRAFRETFNYSIPKPDTKE